MGRIFPEGLWDELTSTKMTLTNLDEIKKLVDQDTLNMQVAIETAKTISDSTNQMDKTANKLMIFGGIFLGVVVCSVAVDFYHSRQRAKIAARLEAIRASIQSPTNSTATLTTLTDRLEAV